MTAAARLPQWAQPKEMLDLVRLAVPVALSRASFMLMGLTDAVVLARHAPGQLPLVLNGWLPNGVFMGFGMGLMLGVSVMTAELNGSGKGADTGRILRRGLWVGAIYGILATLLVFAVARPLLDLLGFAPDLAAPIADVTRILAVGTLGHMMGVACSFYLEALRKPNLVTAVSMAAVLLNLVLDLALVPLYGAAGVAWATTGSRFFMMAAFLVIIWWATPGFRKSAPAPKDEFLRQNKVGIGTGIANIAEWGSFNLTFVIATLVSIDSGTIYGLTIQMMGVIFMIYVGMGTATSVRVAERYGRGDAQGVREASRLGVVASALLGLLLAMILILLRDWVAVESLNGSEAGSDGARLVPTLALMLAFAALVTVFDGLQAVGSMALRAQGVVWTPTIIHVGSYILIMLPLCAWLALPEERFPDGQNYGVWGVFIGISIASVAAGLGQVLTLEWKAARGVRLGLPRAA
jgi:MATE family multidrug resistance protein